ncbi:MAG: hypothetical protein QW097_00630 [archaeon]
MFVLDVLSNGLENVSIQNPLVGNANLIFGAIIFLIAAFILIYIFKHLIANAIAGIIGILLIKFLFFPQIPLNGLTLLISALGGLGGVAAVLIAVFLGWIT